MNKILVLFVTLALSFAANARHHGGQGDGNGGSNNTYVPPSSSNPSASSEQCNDNGQPMSFNNDQVLQWKTSEPNGYHARGYVQGTVDEVFSDMTGHHHFSVQIGSQSSDHIEVIYQLNFGDMPEPQVGEQVIACGDFINSFAQNGGYQPSPDGAIIHWVHRSPSPNHDDGFVILNGQLYGNGNGN